MLVIFNLFIMQHLQGEDPSFCFLVSSLNQFIQHFLWSMVDMLIAHSYIVLVVIHVIFGSEIYIKVSVKGCIFICHFLQVATKVRDFDG